MRASAPTGSARWRAPAAPRRGQKLRARTVVTLALAAVLLVSVLRALRNHGLAAAARHAPRTHPSLLLQHYAARELLFRRDGKRVYFLHIHKGAGSTLCQLAMDAGELVHRDANCNLQDAPKRALAAGPPAAQCSALRNAAVTFVANERGLPDEPHFGADAVYVAVLREPRARYLSQYLHLQQYGNAFLRGEHDKWPAELRYMGVQPEEGVPSFAALLAGRGGLVAAGFRDSFQTRAMAGASTHGLPDGGVSAAHLAAAKAHLSSFDVVLTVEALEQGAPLLAAAAGWPAPNVSAGRRGSSSGSEARLGALDAATRAALDAKVTLDDQLYSYARELGARQRADWQAGRQPGGAARPHARSCDALPGGEAARTSGAMGMAPVTGAGPYGNWTHGCRHDATPFVAACAVTHNAGSNLRPWLAALRAAGVRRLYLHDDDSTDDTRQVLQPFIEDGFVLPLHAAHAPPRYGVRERASGAPWGGYREAQARCVTHALLEGACWLLHVAAGQAPSAPFVPLPTPSRERAAASALSIYSSHMCVRLWPGYDYQTWQERLGRHSPPGFAPWLLNVPMAHAELAASGPHAVVAQPESVVNRAACTKCRGMNPLLGLQDRFTPEVDPCVSYYESAHARNKGRTWCVKDWCGAAPKVPVALHWRTLRDE